MNIDGASLDQWPQDLLGQHLGYLPQEIGLMSGSVADNIARMSENRDDAEVVEAAKRAGAHGLLVSLPEGYDTLVGAGGQRLSAGQRQRVALARAFYGDPPIVILDEPNSNLDAPGEQALVHSIVSAKSRGRTVLVMAHRPSAIAACDLLLMLGDGNQIDFGPRDDVLRKRTRNFPHLVGAKPAREVVAAAEKGRFGMTAAKKSDGWNASRHIIIGFVCIAVLAGGLGSWSATAKLEGAVIASGQLRVETRRQVVQHPDGGVVGEIMVREGDLVKSGDVLIRLDGSKLDSELAVLESQLYEMMARRGRLGAEQLDAESITFDPELLEAAKSDTEIQALVDGQRTLFTARHSTLARELDILEERKVQISEQITGAEAEIKALERQSELIAAQLKDQQSLLEQGLAQKGRVMALEREEARLEGERGQLVARTAQLRGQKAELDAERLRLAANRREEAISNLRELGYRELEMKQRRIALNERRSRLDVRAPLGGVVLDMTVHALKSVVRAAEPILYIVPSDSALVVDALIEPVNIDVVHTGQEAILRFSAFNIRTTPELAGTVAKVSPDAIVDEQTKLAHYRAEVLMKEGELTKLEGRELIPGMPVEVYIQTGRRTPINYLLKPITDYFNRAMREE